jgi:hypothetical protein
MAILQTNEMKGIYPVPEPSEVGEVYEITFKWDTAVAGQSLASGDFLQLMQVPVNAVLTDVRVGASATLGATTVAAGIADALATTALSTTLIAAATITSTGVSRANSLVMADVPNASFNKDQRIVALAIGAEAESTNVIYVTVQYRASRYGK